MDKLVLALLLVAAGLCAGPADAKCDPAKGWPPGKPCRDADQVGIRIGETDKSLQDAVDDEELGGIIAQAIHCAESATDPGDCTSVTVASDAASLDTCMQTAGDHVCYVDETITVTDPSETGAFDFVMDASAAIDLALVCKPGVALVLNQTNASVSKNIVEANLVANSTTNGARLTVSGCTIYQTVNGTPGGGSGTVEGLVFKTTSAALFVQNVIYRDTKVYVYSTGTSSMGCGVNPAAKTHVLYDDVTCYGPIGADLKQDCDGCDDVGTLARNSRFIGNDALANCRSAKIDEDINLTFEGVTFQACPLSVDTDAVSDGGSIRFVPGTGNLFQLIKHASNGSQAIAFGGTAGDAFELRSLTGEVTVYEGGTNEFVQFASSGVVLFDLDIIYARCPTYTQYLDVRALNAGSQLGYLRINATVPQGCTLPTLDQIIGGAGGEDAELDTKNTLGIVKVSNGTTGIANLLDNAATPTQVTLTNDSPQSGQVACGKYVAVADPDAPDVDDFDTGNEIAAYCGYRCKRVDLDDGTDVAACTTDLTGLADTVVVMMQ